LRKNQDVSISDLLRGNTRTLVLSILKDGPAHGYGILFELEHRSEKLLEFKQATLYPLLHDMEEEGLICSEWEVSGGERPRRVYTITESGRTELAKRLETFHEFSMTMYRIVGLDPNES
jgi:PadR family transcriptional regulator PadR